MLDTLTEYQQGVSSCMNMFHFKLADCALSSKKNQRAQNHWVNERMNGKEEKKNTEKDCHRLYSQIFR